MSSPRDATSVATRICQWFVHTRDSGFRVRVRVSVRVRVRVRVSVSVSVSV